jgi:hypothetical protein
MVRPVRWKNKTIGPLVVEQRNVGGPRQAICSLSQRWLLAKTDVAAGPVPWADPRTAPLRHPAPSERPRIRSRPATGLAGAVAH